MRVVQRTDDQWQAIERALLIEQRAQRRGEPVEAGVAVLLAQVRSDVEVSQAAANLQAHVISVTVLFEDLNAIPDGDAP